MIPLIRRDLSWWEPSVLARLLAARFGSEGLVLLSGDGGPQGQRAVLGVDPLETICCRGLPGAAGAADPFAALRAMAGCGGPWLGWLAYEAAAWLEPSVPWREPEMATLWAVRHDPLIHFDLAARRCWLEGRDPQRLEALEAVIAALPGPSFGSALEHSGGAAADDATLAAWPAPEAAGKETMEPSPGASGAATQAVGPAADGRAETVSGENGAAAAACTPPDGLAAGLLGQSCEPAEAPRLDGLAGVAARRPVPPSLPDMASQPAGIPLDAWRWHTTPQRYSDQVGELLQRIAAGDLFQANLTACCETWLEVPPDPLDLWERLSRACPAPFAGVAIASGEAAGEAVISASPERFLQLSPDGLVETRPIKGTRPRSADADQDAAAAADLVCDPKDRAENVMIVDLLRNDLGRVCEPGSISVPQLVGLESYPQVHHLTSVVTGRLAEGRDWVDLLRACWPGGSISGAPKLRACTRLHGLEPVPRGPYCGSLFHLQADGGFDSSILIRSVMVSGRRLRVHAGGGIVADSDPAAEAEEMGWKIRPLLEALA